MTQEHEADFHNATVCSNCDEPFLSNNYKVRYHDHVNGQYLFAACNNCNLQLKPTKCKRSSSKSDEGTFFLPVIFHNGKNYDWHFVLKHFEKKYVSRRAKDNSISFDDVKIIPSNTEKYLQFQIGNIRFLDSYQFLTTSLDELVTLLLGGGKDNFEHTRKHLGIDDDIVFAKGVYPYSYMSSPDKFSETCLPPIESFYDTLRDQPLKEEDYERAKQIWSRFDMCTMQNYQDHYLLTDVFLLADVFENFRQSVMHRHKLDCLHFVTLPSLAWLMALQHTKAKLDLLTHPDMYLMLENSMRGGIATISQRYSSANNPLFDGYDSDEARRYITYLDANSLYATAQSEPLPVGNFRFLSEDEIENFDLFSVEKDADVGYILECDLTYPSCLHDTHNDYPLAPEHLTVTREMLSPFAESLLDPTRPWSATKKLVPNLMNKAKYVSHYRNLQLYVKYGLVVTKIHRIISFTQRPWLKSWIDL